ncbi:phytochrome A-associated F-box protein-like [Phragmites australis]|uniref:phytochrome A-associated F-box protein-like n=1 Tax=Phragmites australis TaxID=29695 RepID=UPI002D77C88B|nr:phytochrome A-associated F-box protein-like [Phragmites australis]XP_062231220.1 phytochrome A-associated F-box protein-like [Phragmites australis]
MAEEEGVARGKRAEAASPLSALADDVLLQILGRLEGDPRDWVRASCASPRLAALLRSACLPPRLSRALPAELLPAPPPDGAPEAWAALHKLSVCCPGLLRAGVLLEPTDDFELELDIGPSRPPADASSVEGLESTATSRDPRDAPASEADVAAPEAGNAPGAGGSSDAAGGAWSLYDDLYLDAAYDFSSEPQIPPAAPAAAIREEGATTNAGSGGGVIRRGVVAGSRRRARRWLGPVGPHLASGSWTLSREQGNKLLASRFRGDRLYLCDWPGCVHAEERRKYMVFRGVFHNFARSQVRRALRETRRPTVAVECAFCGCKEAWDLYSAFCLRSFYGYHDDGEPVVRAYVCENGHVAGAWTERPLYS